MTQQGVNLNPNELWSPNAVDSDAPPVHIVEGGTRPGEMATGLCGVTWRVQRVHGGTAAGSTCEGCNTLWLRKHSR